MNQVITNIEYLYEQFGERIKTNRHLLLIYWGQIDGVRMNGKGMSVSDFLKMII